MKKIVLFLLLGCCLRLNAEVFHLKDGQIIKADIVASSISVNTSMGLMQFEKSKISKIEFTDLISNEFKIIRFNDAKEREMFEYFVLQQKKEHQKADVRSKSMFAIGYGAGVPYGQVGLNAELLLLGHISLTSGIDLSEDKFATYGAKYYFGNKRNAFRWRVSYLVGDMGYIYRSLRGDSLKQKFSGESLFFGFQWKMTPYLSLNFDIGHVKPDAERIDFESDKLGYYKSNDKYADTYNGYAFLKDRTDCAIGLVVHF